ncbi:Leucine-rich repeat-containing protein 15 [Trichoplax sp. H2]|nr:Leucine-rich repeat-containing protein 15 [Trichoplax sp. H2]|eukprot:RDD37224.1 Leucine-rich repeat-containing protein 15 [Trichoplax sp. H2]
MKKFLANFDLYERSLEANRLQVITYGSFNCLTNLKQLMLRSNAVVHIESKAFCSMQNLQYLILDNNRLKAMSQGEFGCLSNLKRLRLKYNAISTIETNSLCGLQSLTRLFVSIYKLD